MFRKRLAWFLVGVVLLAGVVSARLVQLQVSEAESLVALGERMLTRQARTLPAPRGAIRDRTGRALVQDEATYDIRVHYAVFTFSNRVRYLRRLAVVLRRRGEFQTLTFDQTVATLQAQVAETWTQLERFSGRSVNQLVEQADALRRRVNQIRRQVAAHRGFDQAVLEERIFHPVVDGLSEADAIAARDAFVDQPWVRIVPTTQRRAHDSDVLAHLLGRLGEASAERIADDPLAEAPLRRLRPGSLCGVSGVERLAETELRGTRGRVVESRDGRVVERIEPLPGRDVFLTIDHALQSRVYDILRDVVEQPDTPESDRRPYRSGAAAVVIDVHTRAVVALTSYPTYAFDDFDRQYAALRRDTVRQPLRARALQNAYAPGSTCKVITLVGGLSDRVVRPDEHIACTGFLLPHDRRRFRCWIYNMYNTTHDAYYPEGEDGELAIKNSCNIYFFKVGARLGPQRLCSWFEQFGLGKRSGTGLIEENDGVVPTADWLAVNRTREPDPQTADAWNWSIGQGEISATPLQVANVAAAAATGRWAPVQLVLDERGMPLQRDVAEPIAFDSMAMETLRRGMWRVVNDERRGTGEPAKLELEGWVLCGKTGSAQTQALILSNRYIFELPTGDRQEIIAPSLPDARRSLDDPNATYLGRRAHERYPDLPAGEEPPSHAWFMGYTQSASTPLGAAPTGPSYAVAVLVEFGGSGGRVGGPAAKRVAEAAIEVLVADRPGVAQR